MKNQKPIRKLMSLAVCLAIIVCSLSVSAFADDGVDAAATYTCGQCGGTAKWLPGGRGPSSSYTHPYFEYLSDGSAEERICTVTVYEYSDVCMCMTCGTVLLENNYKSEKHAGCGA